MRTLPGLLAVLILFTQPAFAADAPTAPAISYDRAADTLSLDVEQVSLKTLLATIASQSQLEVLFDDRADRKVTMQLEKRSLQAGLENLLRESSYLFRYDKDEEGNTFLLGVRVLPKGESDSGNLQPLLHAAGEAFMNAKHNRQAGANAESALFNKRWQARLAEMPKPVREKVIKHAKERIEKIEKREAERQARIEEKKKEREAKMAERRKEHELKSPDEMTPEEYALHQQRLDWARQLPRH
ncbi:MAG: hypothetical protein R6X15_00065 [Pseudomonadota bacterium]